MIPSNPLPSKPRYEILDGLRGVAAAIVLLYHHFEVNGLGLTSSPINHGYLAVDFFFILSGYVVGYAYDDRWNRMSTWTFFKRRLVRLKLYDEPVRRWLTAHWLHRKPANGK